MLYKPNDVLVFIATTGMGSISSQPMHTGPLVISPFFSKSEHSSHTWRDMLGIKFKLSKIYILLFKQYKITNALEFRC